MSTAMFITRSPLRPSNFQPSILNRQPSAHGVFTPVPLGTSPTFQTGRTRLSFYRGQRMNAVSVAGESDESDQARTEVGDGYAGGSKRDGRRKYLRGGGSGGAHERAGGGT